MYLCQAVPFPCTPRHHAGHNYDGGVIVSHCRKVYCFGAGKAVTHSAAYYSLDHCLPVTRIIKCHQTLSNSIYSICHRGGLSAACSRFPARNSRRDHELYLQNRQSGAAARVRAGTLLAPIQAGSGTWLSRAISMKG